MALSSIYSNTPAQTDRDTVPVAPSDMSKIYRKVKPSVRAEDPISFREPNTLERIGRGAVDVRDGIQQMWLQLTQPDKARAFQEEKDRELAIYEHNAGDGFDFGRLGGQALAASPLMLAGAPAGLIGRTMAGGAEGAASAGSLYTKEGESRLGNAQAGMIGGALIPPALVGARKLGGKVASEASRLGGLASAQVNLPNKIKLALSGVGIDISELSAQAQQNLMEAAQKQLSNTGILDPDSLKRKLDAESLGFVGDSGPTTSQITRSPRQWSEERNLSKLDEAGAQLSGRYRNQDLRFDELKNEVVGNIPDEDPWNAGESVFTAVKDKWKESQKSVGALYKDIREKFGNVRGVEPISLNNALFDLEDDVFMDPIVESVRRRLGKYGDEALTVRQSEELRKHIASLGDQSPQMQRARGIIIDALDDDVVDGVGDDFFKEARSAARARFKDFETKLTKGIVEGKVAPDQLYSHVLRANAADLEGLKSNLSNSGAWDRMRQQVVTGLWAKAAPQGLDSRFSGAAYNKELKKLGEKRLSILFEPDELAQIKKIAEVSKNMTYEPPYSSVNYSNTTPALINLMQKSRIAPMIGDAVSNIGQNQRNKITLEGSLAGNAFDPAVPIAKGEAFEDMISRVLGRSLYGAPSIDRAAPSLSGLALLQYMQEP